jgi:hypothetical protein
MAALQAEDVRPMPREGALGPRGGRAMCEVASRITKLVKVTGISMGIAT